MGKPDFSSTPPIEIGHILAMSLNTGCAIENISDQERVLLQKARIAIEDYHRELLALAGFAHDHAIVVSLGDSVAGTQVRKGYMEVWEQMGRSGPHGAALYKTFISRCPEYAGAAARRNNTDTSTFDPLAMAFHEFLAPSDTPSVEGGIAGALALTYAPIHFRTHFEIANLVLVEAGLKATP